MARRMVHKYLLLPKIAVTVLCGIVLLPLLTDGQAGTTQRVERFAEAMGSTFSIVAYAPETQATEEAIEAAFEEARRLDRMLSNYKPHSELSDVNRHAAEAPVKVSPELFALLEACFGLSEKSSGAFDMTVGPLMKVWGFYRGEGHVPDAQSIARAMTHVGYRNVVLDAQHGTVRFLRPGIELDPGGVGKGYAIDRMAGVLRARGIQVALLSAGGSSIYAMGAPPDSPRGWRIAIQDPLDSAKSAATVFLKDDSLSTSGGYEKFFEAGGRMYSHIMDPRTGFPVTGTLAVSVLCARTLDSEIWAKPFYVLGRAWTEKHLPPGFAVFFCSGAQTESCSWVRR